MKSRTIHDRTAPGTNCPVSSDAVRAGGSSEGSALATGTLCLLLSVVGSMVGCGATNGGSEPVADRNPEGTEAAAPTVSDQEGPGRGMAWVIMGADTVLVEVASTADERRDGLMYREDVPDGTGMLFVFPDERPRSFWMANTYIPLDIAFLDASSRIVDIRQMEAETMDLTESDAPAMFALEVRQGWLGENGVEIGLQAEIVFGPR